MNSIDKLTELFGRFPGIGPRQAKRFVYFLLSRNGDYSRELVRAIEELKKAIIQCQRCQRHFAKNGGNSNVCNICSDDTRDSSLLMVVPRDVDLDALERSGGYNGQYFVLGGVVPILEKEPEKKIRISNLETRINEDKDIKEIILAMNANLDGENTAQYIKDKLSPLYIGGGLAVSILGRGLSTGAELEYADPETLKNALLHRTK
ncbi:MAG: recombination mediator RecR [Parcubacteria group bacterium]